MGSVDVFASVAASVSLDVVTETSVVREVAGSGPARFRQGLGGCARGKVGCGRISSFLESGGVKDAATSRSADGSRPRRDEGRWIVLVVDRGRTRAAAARVTDVRCSRRPRLVPAVPLDSTRTHMSKPAILSRAR